MEELQKVLFDEYNKDPRRKNYKNLNYYTIDNRTRNNLNAKGQPNGAFCAINARIIEENEIEVSFKNIPVDNHVLSWVERNSGNYGDSLFNTLSFRVKKDNKVIIEELASLVLDIKNRHYTVRSYYGSCPEVHYSLNKFYKILEVNW